MTNSSSDTFATNKAILMYCARLLVPSWAVGVGGLFLTCWLFTCDGWWVLPSVCVAGGLAGAACFAFFVWLNQLSVLIDAENKKKDAQ